MNKTVCLIIILITFSSTNSHAAAQGSRRSNSYPMSKHQNAATAHSRKCMRGEWQKKRRGSYDSMMSLLEEGNRVKFMGSKTYNRREIMSALAMCDLSKAKGK